MAAIPTACVGQGYRQANMAAIPTACAWRGYKQAKVAAIPTACVGRGYRQAKIAAIPTACDMRGYEQTKVAAIPTACDMQGYEQAKVAAIPTACVGPGYRQAKVAAIPTLPTATAVRGTHDRKQRTLEPPVLTPCTVGCYVPLRAKGSGSVPAVVIYASRSVPFTSVPLDRVVRHAAASPWSAQALDKAVHSAQRFLQLLHGIRIGDS